jgi:hypothetical protein
MLLILLILLLVLFGGLGILLNPLFLIGLVLVLLIGGGGYFRGNRSHW